MSQKVRKPDAYKTPLRSRKDIIEKIISLTDQRSYDYAPHPFCFNVKAYNCDLDFDHLLELWRKNEGDEQYTHNPEWLEAAREKYDEVSEHLFEWGQEDACSLVTDSDAYNHLWNGEKVDVKYSFEGRGGGWISLNSFEGYDFTRRDNGHISTILNEMDFGVLRKLYQLIVMLHHDWANPGHEIAWHAAYNFFANACSDIPKPDAIQLTLEFEDVGV